MGVKKNKIFIFGTFDVDNYGDLLFPVIARWRLASEVTAVSPTKNESIFAKSDDIRYIDFEQYDPSTCKGSIIGGGNILHFNPSSVPPYLGKSLSYAGLQFYPIKGSIREKFPVIYNSPSIATTHQNIINRHLYKVCLNSSDYLSFRDKYSVDLARKITKKLVYFVPDTAFDISRIWHRNPSIVPTQKKYFIIHVNSRYGGDKYSIANSLDLICKKTQMRAVFLPIGPCHGDIEYAKIVSGLMENKSIIVESFCLKTFAQYISNSEFYLGSSMHGFITSLAYNVKAALILNSSPMPKFQGILDVSGLSDSVIFCNWVEASKSLENIPVINTEALATIHHNLDQHWERIQELLSLGIQNKYKKYTILIRYWKIIIVMYQFFKKILRSTQAIINFK